MGDTNDKPPAKEGWLVKLNLVLTMVLAALSFWLNYNAQQQKLAFDEQKLALDRLQSMLATNRDQREERGSREQMRLQLFDKVSVSLQRGEDRYVEAARALVESLLSTTDPVESELRVGLIRALALGAPVAKQQELKEAANKEATFQTEQQRGPEGIAATGRVDDRRARHALDGDALALLPDLTSLRPERHHDALQSRARQ